MMFSDKNNMCRLVFAEHNIGYEDYTDILYTVEADGELAHCMPNVSDKSTFIIR